MDLIFSYRGKEIHTILFNFQLRSQKRITEWNRHFVIHLAQPYCTVFSLLNVYQIQRRPFVGKVVLNILYVEMAANRAIN